MKTIILLLVMLTGCVSTGTNGYIKTKDDKVTKFKDAYMITWSKEIWIIEKHRDVAFYKRDISEINIKADNYR